jgi:hypothetical protein
MKKTLAIICLVVTLTSCQWIQTTGKQFCENGVGSMKEGVTNMANAGAGIPVVGPVFEIAGWGGNFVLDMFCFFIGGVTSAPNSLSNEGLALIGLGGEAPPEEVAPPEDTSNLPDPEGT